MAEPKKTAQGTWRIIIEVRGQRDSKTLPTRREAIEWRDRRVMELRQAAAAPPVPPGDKHTLRQVLRRYADEVTPAKRGNAKELVRLRAFERQFMCIDTPISKLTTADLAAWRDARLKINARGGVLRDISLLSAVLETARREWGFTGSVAGGMALVPAVADRWEQVTRTPIYQGYGLTETSPVVTLLPFHRVKRGSIGVPVPGTDVRLVDDEGRDVPVGTPGEVVVRGPQVMQGYWEKPEETAQSSTPGCEAMAASTSFG